MGTAPLDLSPLPQTMHVIHEGLTPPTLCRERQEVGNLVSLPQLLALCEGVRHWSPAFCLAIALHHGLSPAGNVSSGGSADNQVPT